ncbi:MAG: class I SAM-dependent methyltransferase [Vicinamibacterales bacterium]|nr:class I SAM-dependent methyltransferase [Vicinamibacterales bacterium]
MINPHFDHHRVIWKDTYSGQYGPVEYGQQFDDQWKLFLEARDGFTRHTGVETDDAWIDDRVYDLTGHRGLVSGTGRAVERQVGGAQSLDLRFSAEYFRDKRCIDIACGAGRWTRALLALGAHVKSVDVSEHGLASVRRFNADVERLDLFEISHRADLHARFDFAICWGVVMCTHDPRLAFANAAATVRPGGSLYVMVYAPTYHNSPEVLRQRRHYHQTLRSLDERLAYVHEVADDPANAINHMDMLNPFYNWVVEEATIHEWFRAHGFTNVVTLNTSERDPVAYHIVGTRRPFASPRFDDHGVRVVQAVEIDAATVRPLVAFAPEQGHAWETRLPEHREIADSMDTPTRSRLVLLEDGRPLPLRHSLHADVRSRGAGQYSHWCDTLIWSTPDNSDPSTNGRTYAVAFER